MVSSSALRPVVVNGESMRRGAGKDMVPLWQRKLNLSNRTGWRESSGTVVVFTGICILVIMGMAGLALDLGQFYVIKSELQRAADAGALAGARALFLPPPAPTSPQCSQAQTTAWQIAQANVVQGATPTVSTPPSYALPYGNWNMSSKVFTPGCSSIQETYTNAVAIRTSLDNVSLIFMGALGFGPRSLSADAVSAKDWANGLVQGKSFVMVIGKNYIQKEPAETYIYLNPDNTDVGGWYAKAPATPSSSLISGYLNNPETIPSVQTGDTLNLNNGSWGGVLNIIASSYVGKTVYCPVVDTVKFNQSVVVTGFTAFKIIEVQQTGHKYVKIVTLKMTELPPGSGTPGGAHYGLLTGDPRLVQ